MSPPIQQKRNPDLATLLKFADAYAKLGTATQEQVHKLLAGEFAVLNSNAVRLIDENLSSHHPEIRDAIQRYNAWRKE